MLDLAFLTEQVRITAKEAGTFIREERKKFDRNVVEKKHAHDYVSYVDKEQRTLSMTMLLIVLVSHYGAKPDC